MKFKVSGTPAEIVAEPIIGNVYEAKGNPGKDGAMYWIVIGHNQKKDLFMLAGLNSEMEVISVASYTREKVETRPRVGFCMEVSKFAGTVQWGM